jgi:Zn-dependent alcohol dehydrogenase
LTTGDAVVQRFRPGSTGGGPRRGKLGPGLFHPSDDRPLNHGLAPFDQLISFYCFDEINQAVAHLQHGETIKAVLVTGWA